MTLYDIHNSDTIASRTIILDSLVEFTASSNYTYLIWQLQVIDIVACSFTEICSWIYNH